MSKKKRTAPSGPKPIKLVAADYWTLHGVALVAQPTDDIEKLARRMLATCIKHNGMAVAAPQVGHNIRLVVLRNGSAILNPSAQPNMMRGTAYEREGCLSYPNRWWYVGRRIEVDVVGIDVFTGEPVGWKEDDRLQARMWQHEVDHLDGLVLDGRYEEVGGER